MKTHHGEKCPVPQWCRVNLKFKSGQKFYDRPACDFDWDSEYGTPIENRIDEYEIVEQYIPAVASMHSLIEMVRNEKFNLYIWFQRHKNDEQKVFLGYQSPGDGWYELLHHGDLK